MTLHDSTRLARWFTAPPVGRRGGALTVLALLTVAALAACTQDRQRVMPTSAVAGPLREVAPLPDGVSLRCPPRPNVTARNVTPGSENDSNGNGVVCDETLAPPGLADAAVQAAVLTTDDIAMPSTSTTATVSP